MQLRQHLGIVARYTTGLCQRDRGLFPWRLSRGV